MRRLSVLLDIGSAAAIIIVAGILLWQTFGPPSVPPGTRPPVETVTGLSLPPESIRHVRGRGSVALVAFSDYECPFCARHAQLTGPVIKKELLDEGQIREVYLNFPLEGHPNAQKAGEAAECAAKQGRFWEMHEALFENPRALDVSDLLERADRLGLDRKRFANCLDTGETTAVIQRDLAEGRRLEVDSTPSFFVGRVQADGTIEFQTRINGAVDFDEFKNAVRELQPSRRADGHSSRSPKQAFPAPPS